MMSRRALPLLGALLFTSCAKPPPTRPEPRPLPPEAGPSELDQRLLEIAGEDQHYGILYTKFSSCQLLCRVYQPPARLSESDGRAAHRGKIYLLYAKDGECFLGGRED